MNDRSNPRKPAIPVSMVFAALLTGCMEPNYRTDVRATGQGGVDVHRLPKDDPTPAPEESSPAVSPSVQTRDQRIDALERQVREKNAEIERLKREKASPPSTAP